MISKEIIDQILMRNEISGVIGSYVSLKRAGSNMKGLCPFHSEKTPSFTVYPASNSFYCFGCGVGGDAVTFIKNIEHLDYTDALRFLAKRAGLTVNLDSADEKAERALKYEKDRLHKMNADAAKFFHACLMQNNPDAKEALAYFTEKRKLSLSTIKHFGLGYAPNSFDSLLKYMLKLGYTYDELTVGFLCGKSDRGAYYDAFRNRVMFPIIDVTGNVIAFGGRVMDDSKPKYKNTSDTPVFKKTRNLFALNFAKAQATESLILCEGYMDVIALHAAGVTNAVATLGTAITSDQSRLLSRYTKRVIISYDADEAGQKAAKRALEMLGEVGLDVKVLVIPGAKDPDEYIKTHGVDKFKQLLSDSKSEFEYRMDAIMSKYDINFADDKVKALKELVALIGDFGFSAEREIYMQIVSQKFSVSKESIALEVKKILSRKTYVRKKEESRKSKLDAMGYTDKVNPDFVKAPAAAKNEESVLALLLLYPEHRKTVFEEALLSEEDFFTELGKRIFNSIKCGYEQENSLPDFNDGYTAEEVGRITKMKLLRMELSDNGTAVLRECIESLKSAVEKKNGAVTNTYEGLSNLLEKLRKD